MPNPYRLSIDERAEKLRVILSALDAPSNDATFRSQVVQALNLLAVDVFDESQEWENYGVKTPPPTC